MFSVAEPDRETKSSSMCCQWRPQQKYSWSITKPLFVGRNVAAALKFQVSARWSFKPSSVERKGCRRYKVNLKTHRLPKVFCRTLNVAQSIVKGLKQTLTWFCRVNEWNCCKKKKKLLCYFWWTESLSPMLWSMFNQCCTDFFFFFFSFTTWPVKYCPFKPSKGRSSRHSEDDHTLDHILDRGLIHVSMDLRFLFIASALLLGATLTISQEDSTSQCKIKW